MTPPDASALPPAAKASPPARRGDPVLLSWVSVVLLLVALVTANAAVARTRVRVDLTEDKLFSLSESSRRVAALERARHAPTAPRLGARDDAARERVDMLHLEREAA